MLLKKRKPKVETVPFDDNYETLLICSERYAIGRRTYMPGLIVDIIKPAVGKMSIRGLTALKRDIEEYGIELLERSQYEMWANLLSLISEELVEKQEALKRNANSR